jgi:tetratricopeptide (TPR) repeat protein
MTKLFSLSSGRNVPQAISAIGLCLLPVLAQSATLETRRDAREPSFKQVMYYYYLNQPYDALTSLLSNRALEFNATGTVNVLLGDLYARYGLTREADAALSRATNSDVTANNRNNPWLRYGKLLYNTGQDSLALNFLRKPPTLLTPLQESERVITVANILLRQERVDEAIEVLQDYRTPSPFYRQLARYNLGLALLQPAELNGKPINDAEKERRTTLAIGMFEQLLTGKVTDVTAIIAPTRPNTATPTTRKKLFSSPKQSLVDNRDLGNASTLTANAVTRDIEDESITDTDRLNLRDKVALSLAYLHLSRKNPEAARLALRDVRLNSPYSNQALLTSAHVYYQLADFNRAYNFATELSSRNASDPMVQEGWLLAARALEDNKKPDEAITRYQQAVQVYKAQTSAISQLSRQIEQIDILRLFPIQTNDPILLDLPPIPNTPQQGLWSQLLDRPDVLSVLQQIRQTQVLQQRTEDYGQRLARLNQSGPMDEDLKTQLQDSNKLYEKVHNDFLKAGLQDRKALIARVQQPLQQRQLQLDRYLTEALLGLQRLGQTANKDR